MDQNFDYKKKYYKFTFPNENHRGYQYKDGLNTDVVPLNYSNNCCSGGGLYFTDINNLSCFSQWMKPGGYLREVEIPMGEPVVKEYAQKYQHGTVKYKSNKIILGKKIELNSDEALKFVYDNYGNNQYKPYNHYNPILKQMRYKLLYSNNEDYSNLGEKYFYPYDVDYIMKSLKRNINEYNKDKMKEIVNDGLKITTKHHNKINLAKIIYACIQTQQYWFFDYLKRYVNEYEIPNNDINFLSNQETIKNINEDLKEKYGEELIEILKKYDCVISGSYILYHLTNKSFKTKDIDIYVNRKYYTMIYNELYKKLGKEYRYSQKCTYNLKEIHGMLNIEKKNKGEVLDLQFIFIKDECKIKDFITRNFDFSMCQIWYDFKEIESSKTIEMIKEKMGIVNPIYIEECDKINEIRENYRAVYRVSQTMERYFKYSNRGYKIYGIESLVNILCKLKTMEREEARKELIL